MDSVKNVKHIQGSKPITIAFLKFVMNFLFYCQMVNAQDVETIAGRKMKENV